MARESSWSYSRIGYDFLFFYFLRLLWFMVILKSHPVTSRKLMPLRYGWSYAVNINIFTAIIIVVALSVISTMVVLFTVVIFLAWHFSRRNATNRHGVG